MKTLIYQYYYTPPERERSHHMLDDSNEYYELSRRSISAYAESIGADYKYLTQKHPVSPFYGIFLPFTEKWCYDYDAICFIDSDILATTHARNVFEHSMPDRISASFLRSMRRWRQPLFEWWADKGHINSGVVVFPHSVYNKVYSWVGGDKLQYEFDNRTVLETSLGNFDQAIVNKIARDHNKYLDLDNSFNYNLIWDPKPDRWQKDLIHYHRENKPLMIEDFNDERIMK